MTLTNLIELEEFGSSTGSEKKQQQSASSDSSDKTAQSKNTMVQLPWMSMRGFMQEVAMRSGHTLVLSGFEELSDGTTTSGIGKAKMGLLGGQAANETNRQVLVVLLTPEVLQSPLSQEALVQDY